MTTFPNEIWPADALVEALDATIDQATGLPYVAKGTGPNSSPSYEVQYNRRQERVNRILATVRSGMVVAEGGLNIGVYPISYSLGGVKKDYLGATAVAVTDNTTGVVYLDSANVLQVVAGFPSDPTTYLPLAEWTSSSGLVTVTDHRHVVLYRVAEFSGSVDVGDLSVALQDAIPDVTIAVGTEAANAIAVTVQVRDAADNNRAGLFLLRCWLSDTAGGGETTTSPSGGTAVTTGTLVTAHTADRHLVAVTDATGLAVLTLTEAGARTWFVNAEFDGVVVSSVAVTFV